MTMTYDAVLPSSNYSSIANRFFTVDIPSNANRIGRVICISGEYRAHCAGNSFGAAAIEVLYAKSPRGHERTLWAIARHLEEARNKIGRIVPATAEAGISPVAKEDLTADGFTIRFTSISSTDFRSAADLLGAILGPVVPFGTRELINQAMKNIGKPVRLRVVASAALTS